MSTKVQTNTSESLNSFSTPLKYVILQGSLVYGCLLSSIVCSLYIKTKLEVNPFVKRILMLDTMSKIILMSVGIVGHFKTFVVGQRDLYSCSLAILPNLATSVGSYVYPAAMSLIRYHMATSMENHQHFKIWYISLVTGIAIGSQATLCLVMFGIAFGFNASFGPVLQTCLAKEISQEVQKLLIGPALTLVIGSISLVLGIVYDIAMYRFLKRRNSAAHPHIAMVAWEPPLVSAGPNDKMKATVPIKATALGCVNLCIICLVIYFVVFHFSASEFGQYAFRTCLGLYAIAQMPLILFLTVHPSVCFVSPSSPLWGYPSR